MHVVVRKFSTLKRKKVKFQSNHYIILIATVGEYNRLLQHEIFDLKDLSSASNNKVKVKNKANVFKDEKMRCGMTRRRIHFS